MNEKFLGKVVTYRFRNLMLRDIMIYFLILEGGFILRRCFDENGDPILEVYSLLDARPEMSAITGNQTLLYQGINYAESWNSAVINICNLLSLGKYISAIFDFENHHIYVEDSLDETRDYYMTWSIYVAICDSE